MSFDIDIKKFAKTVGVKAEAAHRKIGLDVFNGVVRKTPVDKGRARAGWNISIGSIDPSVPEEGKKSYSSPSAKLGVLKEAKVIWISNSLPYILFLEEGSSKQAPAGMMALTLEEVKQGLLKAI